MTTEYRRLSADDTERLARLRAQAFNVALDPEALAAPEVVGRFRGVFRDGRLVAALRVEPASQMFGGRGLPSAAVSSVVVAPHERGRGLGGLLLREALAELASQDFALSVLNPTVVGVYRAVGYEIGGSRVRYSVPVADLPAYGGGLDVREWSEDQAPQVRVCYERFAHLNDGLFERAEGPWWSRTLASEPHAPLFGTVVRRGSDVVGYILYRQVSDGAGVPGEEAAYRYRVECRDLVWLDGEAAGALLGSALAHTALGTRFGWIGPIADPLCHLFPAGRPAVDVEQRWLSRVLAVEHCLTGRGWPPGASSEVDLRIEDPVLPGNRGCLRLRVHDGHGEVQRIGAARTVLGVDTLAALLTGWLTPHAAARLGRITGAREEDLDRLAMLFPATRPWLIDWF